MHPGHYPGGAVVGGVGHIHAPRAAQDNGPRTRGFGHHFHEQSRFATLACPVTRGEELLEWELFDGLEGLQLLSRIDLYVGRHRYSILSNENNTSAKTNYDYSRSPIHCVSGSDLPCAAR